MALHTINVTLGADATQVTTVHTPCKLAKIFNDTGNAAVKVGDKFITSTNYGIQVQVLAPATGMNGIEDIGPFSGDTPFNLDEIWLLGTQSNIIRILYVT